MKQYTRVYVDVATGDVIGVHTQDVPFAEGFEPIGALTRGDGSPIALEKHDLEMTTDRYVPSDDLIAELERAPDRSIRFKAGRQPDAVTEMIKRGVK